MVTAERLRRDIETLKARAASHRLVPADAVELAAAAGLNELDRWQLEALRSEAPRLLFPFARQIISEAVSNSGFPPLLLDPIDFTAAYMSQVQQQEGIEGGGAGGDDTPSPTQA